MSALCIATSVNNALSRVKINIFRDGQVHHCIENLNLTNQVLQRAAGSILARLITTILRVVGLNIGAFILQCKAVGLTSVTRR